MQKIKQRYVFSSAAFTLTRKQIRFYKNIDKPPEPGDVVYGAITWLGQHSSLENKSGRIHIYRYPGLQ